MSKLGNFWYNPQRRTIYGGWMDSPQAIAQYHPFEGEIEFLTSAEKLRHPLKAEDMPSEAECLEIIERQEIASARNKARGEEMASHFDRMEEEAYGEPF